MYFARTSHGRFTIQGKIFLKFGTIGADRLMGITSGYFSKHSEYRILLFLYFSFPFSNICKVTIKLISMTGEDHHTLSISSSSQKPQKPNKNKTQYFRLSLSYKGRVQIIKNKK